MDITGKRVNSQYHWITLLYATFKLYLLKYTAYIIFKKCNQKLVCAAYL
jgi:hypothetical protein